MEYRIDSYSGFNDYDPLLDTDDLKHDITLQQAVLKTSHGRRAPASTQVGTQKTGIFSKLKNVFTRPKNTTVPVPSARLGTASRAVLQQNSVAGAQPGSVLHRPVTAQKRPSTAIKSAGFLAGSGAFGSYTPVLGPTQYETKDESNEEKARRVQRTIFSLVEESCFAHEENNIELALEQAEEAMKLDKTHVRYRDEHNMSESDVNLSGFVILNCANMFAKCGMKVEAMNLYNLILKNKLLPVHSRVRINIGNIFVSSKQYSKALKMYRMALDQISEQNVNLKMKVRQNISATHILMGQYAEAAQIYEIVMQERPNYRCGLNLLLCYYAIGQLDKTRRAFSDLLKIPFQNSEDNYPVSLGKKDKQVSLVTEAIRDDRYKQMERKRHRFIEQVIVTAAKIIGNISEEDSSNGYEWCIEQVRNSTYLELASGLEIQKAIAYLRKDNFPKAIATLKEFEKAEAKLASAAATNLSFLHFLKKDFNNAHKYADLALKSDKFNPASLTNKGNCCFAQHDYEKARYYYEKALNIDAGCVQALHNLILTLIQSKQYQRVKHLLHKYATMQPDNSQVSCLMAKILQETQDFDQAKSWYLQALSSHRTDGHLHRRLGELIDSQGDKSEALQYYFDAYRHSPCDIQTLEWLVSYYIEKQYPEKAIEFCMQAALVKPEEIKWNLMVASCYRRTGNYAAALDKYKWIHQRFPDDIDCIQFLIKICIDLGLPDREVYENELKKVTKMKEIEFQRKTSANKSQHIVKGHKISSAERDVAVNTRNQIFDDHRKRTPINLDNTEGVFSQQGPITMHPYVDQLPQQITYERPKTAISRKETQGIVFDDNDNAAELLPD
ncbi:unnamed protein product [Rotaria magnacalcarata]|uniref:Intraflagellar transport protein 88 homolog n=2 Tax=Rotaria magnacalcarata TaxID=392030 RepID=A0A816Z508_9BILA|nr:unnamed protein product [Rotaria magnacalcarata]